MSRARKNFKERRLPDCINQPDDGAKVALPPNPYATRQVDLGAWIGVGIDAWVLATTAQLKAFVNSKSVSSASVVAYSKALKYFFKYLRARAGSPTPQLLQPDDLAGFVEWLRRQSRMGDVSSATSIRIQRRSWWRWPHVT